MLLNISAKFWRISRFTHWVTARAAAFFAAFSSALGDLALVADLGSEGSEKPSALGAAGLAACAVTNHRSG